MNTLRPVVELFGKNFNIPPYQRGYRWEEQEITELLDDLWDFQQNPDQGNFYCLQPIVVQENAEESNTFDLIDGQQRLTTLYLILVYLENRRFDDGYTQELFTLDYTTRKASKEFLSNQLFKTGIDESNIDFYHICHAYQYIKAWFERTNGAKGKMTNILMDNDGKNNRNVKVIWYKIDKDEDPIDSFIRLNVGKIPLTDAELIKALILQSDRYTEQHKPILSKKLYEIANEWDSIEYDLQKEELWFFLNEEENSKPTQIEFIFNLIADQEFKNQNHPTNFNRDSKHATFIIINQYLKSLISQETGDEDEIRINAITTFWSKVTRYYSFFNEWYQNRELYHYIGYLVAVKRTNITQELELLISEAKKRKKTEFTDYLITRISAHINFNKQRADQSGQLKPVKLEELSYYSLDGKNDKYEIHQILLLHNVITTFNSDKELALFPFNLYKKNKSKSAWSLEHIHPQSEKLIENSISRKLWLADHIQALENLKDKKFSQILLELKVLDKQENISKEELGTLQKQVNDIFQKQTNVASRNIQMLGNLCLIDSGTNSELNNSVFEVKQEKIKKREVRGHYIPIASRNAFLKAYTSFPSHNAFWTARDMEAYVQNIKTTLHKFLKPDWQIQS